MFYFFFCVQGDRKTLFWKWCLEKLGFIVVQNCPCGGNIRIISIEMLIYAVTFMKFGGRFLKKNQNLICSLVDV